MVNLPPLPTATCPLATQLTVAAECTWVPTGERVRLPALTTSTLQLTLAWAAPPAIVVASDCNHWRASSGAEQCK